MAAGKDPDAFLPLTSAVFHVLLALSDDDRHGYGIAKEVAEQTGARVRLGPGTLYGTLARLLDAGLVEDRPSRGKAPADDRRRYYRLTALGRTALTAEAHRLSELVALPSTRALLKSDR
jgi:DNA-binding PadR family transcriptional regulator